MDHTIHMPGCIHLEIAHSLSTISCMMALCRFICRRGWSIEFVSDNGKKFQRGESRNSWSFTRHRRGVCGPADEQGGRLIRRLHPIWGACGSGL